jgi:Outer membrane receptor proteins, mostly Fe transport
LAEVTISGVSSGRKGSNLSVGPIEMRQAIPVMGEDNINLVFQQKAGVAHAQEINPGLFVRGLSSSQNQVLLNGTPIFNANHTLGIFPPVNAKTISKAELLTDYIHPKYGDFLSACMVMEGNNQLADSSEFMLGIGGLTSHIYNQAPIVRGKISYMVAARQSYFDLIANYYNKKFSTNDSRNRLPNYWFHDINGAIVFQPTEVDKVVVAGYYSNDKLMQRIPYMNIDWNWGNTLANISWERRLTSNFTFRLSYDDSRYNTNMHIFKVENSQIVNRISQNRFLADGALLVSNAFQLDAGVFLIHMQTSIKNNTKAFNGDESVLNEMSGAHYNCGGYLAASFSLGRYLHLKSGLRMYCYDGKDYYFSPRLFLQSPITSSFAVFAAFSNRQQFDHLYSSMGINQPADMIIPSDSTLKPQKSQNISVGVKIQLCKSLQVLSSLYYIRLKNQLDFVNPEPLYEGFYFTSGKGTSKGAELTLLYGSKRLNIESSYSYCKSLRKFDQINNGHWFHPPFDITHKFDFFANIQLSRKLSLSVSQFVQSGNIITVPTSIYYNQAKEQLVPLYTTRYNLRLPLAHRLDMVLQYTVVKRYGTFRYGFGVYNLYNQANPYFIYFDPTEFADGRTSFTTKKCSLLPMVPFFMIELTL